MGKVEKILFSLNHKSDKKKTRKNDFSGFVIYIVSEKNKI